jgi:4-amino-4-deoxy-L-arabinose transferase-like glycosyltransferase
MTFQDCRPKSSLRGWSTFLILFIIVVALSSISQRWIRQNFETIPPPWDQSLYLYMAYKFWHALMDGGLPALTKSVFSLIQNRAPLVPLTTLPFFMISGFSLQTAYLTNALYLFVLLGSVFQLGCWLRGWRAGLISAFVCATLPALINYSRDYLLDFPMAAVISVALYTLLRSQLFKDRRYSFAFGISSGLAVLAKAMAIAYLAPLFVYIAVIASTVPGRRKEVLRSLGLALTGFAVVAGPWYLLNFTHAFGNLLWAGFGAGSVPYRDAGQGILTWRSLTYYPRFLLGYGLSLPYLILFLGLLGWKVINTWLKGKWRKGDVQAVLRNPYTILGVWLLTAYVILTVTPSKDFERYTLPLLPAIAVLIGCWIETISSATLRTVTTVAVGLIGLFNYCALTFGIALLPPEIRWSDVTLFSQQHYLKRWFPYRHRWPIPEALATMASQIPLSQTLPAKIYVMPNHAIINSNTLMAYSEEKRYPFWFTLHSEKIFDPDRVRSFDFVLIKTGEDQGPKFANANHEQAVQTFNEVKEGFTLLRRMPLPDSSDLEIFMKRTPALIAPPTPMHPSHIVYGGFIELVGYDFQLVPKAPGSYAITYYWKCLQTVWDDYTVFVPIARSEDGKVVAWQDHRLLNGSYPLYRWRPGEVFAEQYRLQLAAGSYRLMVGLYRPDLSPADPSYRPQITAAPVRTPIDDRGTRTLIGTVNVKLSHGIADDVSHKRKEK